MGPADERMSKTGSLPSRSSESMGKASSKPSLRYGGTVPGTGTECHGNQKEEEWGCFSLEEAEPGQASVGSQAGHGDA